LQVRILPRPLDVGFEAAYLKRTMQRTLVFTREERLLLIEAAVLTARVSPTLARRLKGLLMQLELTAGKEGCFPGQELLAAKLGTTKRTIGKWVEQLRQLRILSTVQRSTWAGRRQLDYHVDWAQLRSFCTPEQLTSIEEKLRSGPKNFVARCEAGSSRDAKPVRRPYSLNSFTEEEAFLQLVQEVTACGVDQAVPAVNAALAGGCTVEQIRAAIAHYRTLTHSGVKPGALYVKLKTMSPGEAANRRFPKADASPAALEKTAPAANRQQALRLQLQELEQAEREAETAARDRENLLQLEAEYGGELDQLSRDQLGQLVEQTGSAGLQAEFRRKPSSALVRAELLKVLSQRKESIA